MSAGSGSSDSAGTSSERTGLPPAVAKPQLGGLLIVWTLGLVAFPLRFAVGVYETYLPLFGFRPGGDGIGGVIRSSADLGALALVLGAMALDVASLGAWFLVVPAYFRRERNAPRLMFVFLVVNLGINILNATSPSAGPNDMLAGLLLWLPFLHRSPRLKTTFTLPPTAHWISRSAAVLSVLLFVGLTGWSYHRAGTEVEASPVGDPVSRAMLEFERSLRGSKEFIGWANQLDAKATAQGLSEAEKESLGQREGAALAAGGLLRLPYEDLRRRAILMRRMLDDADEADCAKRARGEINYQPLLRHLPAQALRDWFEIGRSSMLEEIRATTPALSADDGLGIVGKFSTAAGAERVRLNTALAKGAPDADACWAVRWMYRVALSADSLDAKPFVRWLAVQ